MSDDSEMPTSVEARLACRMVAENSDRPNCGRLMHASQTSANARNDVTVQEIIASSMSFR